MVPPLSVGASIMVAMSEPHHQTGVSTPAQSDLDRSGSAVGPPQEPRIHVGDDETVMIGGLYVDRAEDGGHDLLRSFRVHVQLWGEYADAPLTIGTVTGWIGWEVWNENVWEAADAISSDAEPLGAAVEELRTQLAEDGILINSVVLLGHANK